jgi:DNA primase
VPIYDYFFDSAFSRFDFKTAEGKRKIGEELTPILAKISNEIVRDHYVNQLAEKLAVSEEAIREEIKKIKSGEPAFAKASAGKVGEGKTRREVLEEHLLALAFQAGKWDYLRKRQVISLVKTPRFARILEVLGEGRKKYKSFDSSRLAKMLPAELKEVFDGFYLLNLADLATEEEKFAQEFKKTVGQLGKIDLQELLNQTASKIKKLEKQGKLSKDEEKQLEALHQEFRDLSQKLSEVYN